MQADAGPPILLGVLCLAMGFPLIVTAFTRAKYYPLRHLQIRMHVGVLLVCIGAVLVWVGAS